MVDAATRRAFTSLVAAACIDGRVSSEERRYLDRKAQEFGVPASEADDFIRQGMEGRFTVAIPPTPAGKQALFEELMDVACADGKLEGQERQLLKRFSTHLGFDADDLSQRLMERLNMKRPARKEAPAPKEPPPQLDRVDHPGPIKFVDAPSSPPPPRPAAPPPDHEDLLAVKPGPITLGAPSRLDSDGISPVTRELVKSVIRFEGREAAVEYLLRTCGFTNPNDARAAVDRLMVSDPDCKPGASAVEVRNAR